MTLVSGDITLGKMTFGRLDRKPYQTLHKNVENEKTTLVLTIYSYQLDMLKCHLFRMKGIRKGYLSFRVKNAKMVYR